MEQYDFGKHTKDVLEVIEFARSDKVLSGGQPPNDMKVKVIRDTKEIPDQEYYFKFNDERLIWKDILGGAEADARGARMKMWSSRKEYPYAQYFNTFCKELLASFKNRFPSEYIQKYIHEAAAVDLTWCAEARLVMGKTHEFYEEMFKAYQSGGYPCGWEGNYPEGQLIVFYPNEPQG